MEVEGGPGQESVSARPPDSGPRETRAFLRQVPARPESTLPVQSEPPSLSNFPTQFHSADY